MTHSFIPLAKPQFSRIEKNLVKNCMDTGWISSIGKYVEQFGQKTAKFVGTKYALPVCNGTAALHLSLIALGIGPGDEVIVPALTFVASVNTITYTGAKPVFVDIEPKTFNLDINQLESVITKRCKAIMTVDLYGHPIDFDRINKIAKKHHLKVISDSAESLGSLYKNKLTGSQTDVATFSFFGNKIITTGEGGMITTNNKELYDKLKLYRDQGKYQKTHMYYHSVIGYNYAMTNLQAAVGIGQLSQLKKLIRQKRQIATKYKQLLADVPGISFQQEADYAQTNWWMFSILIDKKKFGRSRDELMQFLKTKNIETRPFFFPMHQLPFYKTKKRFPVTEKISSMGINLPTYAGLNKSDQDYIIESIKSAKR